MLRSDLSWKRWINRDSCRPEGATTAVDAPRCSFWLVRSKKT